jgi:hypothetical protein
VVRERHGGKRDQDDQHPQHPGRRLLRHVADYREFGRSTARGAAGEGGISGRILSSSAAPIADATVLLALTSADLLDTTESEIVLRATAWWTATTNQDGAYAFRGLPSGRFIVIAAKAGYAGWQTIPRAVASPLVARASPPAMAFSPGVPRMVIDLIAGGRASEVNLTLHVPSTRSGHVIGRDGSPVAGQRAALYLAGSGIIDSMRGGPPTGRVSMDGGLAVSAVAARIAFAWTSLSAGR